VVDLLALLLLVILWGLIQCCGELADWTAVAVHVFLSSCVLTSEACRWLWLRVCFWKAYIWCSLALPGRQLGLAHYVTHCWCVCVLCYMHTQWLGVEHAHRLCELLVCVYIPDTWYLACAWLWDDQLGRADPYPQFFLSF
jgi:hypothetical protein